MGAFCACFLLLRMVLLSAFFIFLIQNLPVTLVQQVNAKERRAEGLPKSVCNPTLSDALIQYINAHAKLRIGLGIALKHGLNKAVVRRLTKLNFYGLTFAPGYPNLPDACRRA